MWQPPPPPTLSPAPVFISVLRTVARRLVLPTVGAGECEIARSVNACVSYTRYVRYVRYVHLCSKDAP